MLSKKYYIEFGKMIKKVTNAQNVKSKQDTILFITDYLCDFFETDNRGFRIDKFLDFLDRE
ncbi:hypothetical protein K8R33_04195 [archaeon]|nr:hypothetical protein [archaeon]